MFNYRAFFAAAVAAVALVGCNNEEIVDHKSADDRIPITFTTYLPRVTRLYVAQPVDIWALVNNGFSMTAVNNVTGVAFVEDETFNVEDSETGICSASDEYYWPKDTAVTFCAFYPTGGTLDVENHTYTFEPTGYADAIVAGETASASDNDGLVTLNFKHILAMVALSVKCDNADYGYELTKVLLVAPKKAVYDFQTQAISVVANTDSTEFDIHDVHSVEYTQYPISVDETLSGLDTLMVAADGTTGSLCRLTMEYQATYGNVTKSYTKSAQVNLVAGYLNKIDVTISGDTPLDISVTAPGWSGQFDANGHEYVDLGLPSGTLWATCNIGAESLEGYGDYYAWGETTGYNENTPFSWEKYSLSNGSYDALKKYCSSEEYGEVDALTELELADDAARVNWGGSWRMPTREDFHELYDECTWTWSTVYGVTGYRVSASNGNYIFLPAAYYRYDGEVYAPGDNGYYWSSSLADYSYCATVLYFHEGSIGWGNSSNRSQGLPIRAVIAPEKTNVNF